MKKKKILVTLLIFIILITQIGIMNFFNSSKVYASQTYTQWNSYFYNQLSSNAKAIYNAMFEMFNNYKNGKFTKGESIEITDRVTASSIALFVNGNNELLNDYGAARDAFQYDYPDCFFINWDELSIRVTQDSFGTLHAFLGAGRSDTYLSKGMNENRSSKANGGYGNGIKGAIAQYEAKLAEVVNNIKSKTSSISNKNEKIEKMLGEAHDYVTNNMVYKHEWETTSHPEKDNVKSSARTAYDGLIFGEGVCEAYTRTFKALCDRLDIPCICVYGIYSPKTTINEPHIWNYVQIDGKWYGIDTTHDDPTVLEGMFIYSKNENRDFFLVGNSQLAAHHFPQGIVSDSNFKFEYPTLEQEAYRDSYLVETQDGFSILIEKDNQLDNWNDNQSFDSGTFYVSYEGMNFTQNAARGKYMVVKYYNYNPGSDTWDISDWSYIDPWIVLFGDNDRLEEIEPSKPKNGKYCVRLELPQTKKVQFAITEIPPAYLNLKTELARNGWSQDLSIRIMEALNDEENPAAYVKDAIILNNTATEIVENKWGDYVAPPMPTKSTPSQSGCLYVGSTHHIKLEFNDNLKLKSEDSVPGIQMTVDGGAGTAGNWNAGHSALDNAKVSNVKWDGKNTVEFDFEASDKWADDCSFYNFQVTGLIGYNSNRTPVAASYGLRFPRYCYAYAAQGYKRNVYAQPQLMDTSDIDMSNWDLKDVDTHSNNYGKEEKMSEFLNEIAKNNGNSEEFLDSLHDRLTLVTTQPSPLQTEEMEHYLETDKNTKKDFANAKEGTINTYNISISVCKKQVLRTGEGVRIALGFPKGTSYEDFAESGELSFKAYHYKVDPKTDKLTGEVEEIPVTVTRQGLVLWVDSFSPFTVMAVENENPTNVTQKDILVTSNLGGIITDESGKKLEGESSKITLKDGQNAKVKIVPDDGYEIDYIMIDGIRQNITNKLGQSIEIPYNTVETGSIINAGFVAKQIHEEEESQNLSSDFKVPNISINFNKETNEYVVGDNVSLKPVVTVTGGDFHPKGDAQADKDNPDYISYQWLKVTGERPCPIPEIADQTSEALTFESITNKDAGEYYLRVTPMKWNNDTKKYEAMKIDKTVFSKTSNRINIVVYNKLNLDLLSDSEKPNIILQGNSEDGYKLELGVGDQYKLTPDVYRLNGDKKKVEGNKVTFSSDHPENVYVDITGELRVDKYTNDPVIITAKTEDINGKEIIVKVNVTIRKIEITNIELNKSEITLEVDGNKEYNTYSGEEELFATISPEEANNEEIIWTVADENVAYIKKQDNNNVIVIAKKVGKTTVTANCGGKEAVCNVNVVETPVTSISDDIDNKNIYLVEPLADGTGDNTSYKIDVNVLPENATNKKVTWTSSDESVATVKQDDNGNAIITPVADNDSVEEDRHCIITVKSESNPEIKNEYNVYVSETLVKVENVEIKYDSSKGTILTVGEGLDLNAHITPQNADIKAITWKVIDGTDVVSVNDSGYVHAKAPGTATVELTVECQASDCNARHTDKIEITVNPIYAEKITLNDTKISLRKDNTHTLTAIITPLDVTDSTITWKSSNPQIAEVDSDGKVKAIAVGKATITASCPNATASCEVTVTPIKVERLHINYEKLKLKDIVEEENKTKLEVTYEPPNADNVKLKWESSDKNVATVNDEGIITPIKPGKTTILVSVDGDDDVTPVTCEVTVVPSEKEVVIYTVDQNDKFLPRFKLRLMKTDENMQEQLVKEISGDGKFDFGKLADGTYTIYITEKTKKDFNNNEVNVIDILKSCQFEIIDGEILLQSEDGLIYADAIVLKSIVDYPDSEGEEKLKASFESSKEDTENRYLEFLKTKPVESENPPKPDDDKQGGNSENNSGNEQDIDQNNNQNNNSNGNNSSNNDNTLTDNTSNQDNTVSNSPLPKTSDIAIGLYVIIMVSSITGIILITHKKNKK